MSLRRTALVRRTQLRRTPMPRRKKALATRRAATSSGRRGTGPSTRTRELVAERAGYCCEICGLSLHNGTTWTEPYSVHHRRPRGAGGSRDAATNSPANLLLLCGSGITGCHGRVERDRSTAYVFGWLVRQGHDPETVPVWVWRRGEQPVQLTIAGQYVEAA